MDRIKFQPGDHPFGLVELDVEHGAVVIIVEHGLVQIGRYHAPAPPEQPHPAFEAPSNGDALRSLAYQAVMSHFPGMNLLGGLKVFSCPAGLAAKAHWPASVATTTDAPAD